MPVYEYKGVTAAGKKVSGVQDAESLKAVRSRLKKDGVTVLEIHEGAGLRAMRRGSTAIRFGVRVKLGDLANATRQLATLLSSGLPLMEALSVLVEQEENEGLKAAMSSVRDLNGKPLYIVGMVIDIDKQKHAAEELHKSQAQFQAIFDNVAVGVAVMTLGRRVLAMNTAANKPRIDVPNGPPLIKSTAKPPTKAHTYPSPRASICSQDITHNNSKLTDPPASRICGAAVA